MRAFLFLVALSACGVTDPGDGEPGGGPGGGKADDANPHRLAGYDEVLLAGGDGGKLALLHVGETFNLTALDASPQRESPVVIRSHGGMFYALFRDGTLMIVDPEQRAIVRRVELPAGAVDIEWASESELYVSLGAKSEVRRIGLDGFPTGTLDLSSLRGTASKLELRRMRKVGDRLYVQLARTSQLGRPDRGAVAVIDTTVPRIETAIELQALDDTSAALTGIEPDFDMAFDADRDLLYVTALGQRPSNTGGLFRIDTTRAELHDAKRAQSGFQGTAVIGAPYSTLFMLYHTSTPTTSSHLFDYRVTETGALEPTDGGALVDTFDGLDALAINADGTLVAMANTCITGFCVRGAGIAFVDTRTSEVLPKLLKDKIGFEPSIVQFR